MTRRGAEFVECRRVHRGGSPARVSHLLVADDALSADRWDGSQITVGGAEVHPGSPTAVEADEDPGYCPACVRAAVRWSTRSTAR